MKVVIDTGWNGELRLTPDALREFFKCEGIEYTEEKPEWALNEDLFAGDFFVKIAGEDEADIANRVLKNHRSNPALVGLIEEWGEKAALEMCQPRIVEIPDDVDWEIASPDVGQEWIQEKHRVWGFEND